ncbi:MAG: sigma 54-interacting transcriptional regulator [Planctomycetes bacterium]|nr:sigma 54-interacting transcriptional regulator [Planctomycetota bacterium]
MSPSESGVVHDLFESPVPFANVLNRLPVGVAILDAGRRILYMNSALEALCGFDLEQVRGVPSRYALRTNLCRNEGPVDEAARGASPVATEGNLITRARKRIPVRFTTTPLLDAAENLVGFLETIEDATAVQEAGHELQKEFGFGQLLGHSPRMKELFDVIPVIAQTDSSVLVTGETGTGKDMLAEVIHEASDRGRGPFVKVNCGALPETLLESELFGHTKGAFTGAVSDRPGRIRLAHNGTLYLTEIGDLPLSLQVKLLTFLDDKVVYPLGGSKGFQANVRIIAATHRNLEQMLEQGRFRQDLLYRLNVIRMHLPPLRERPEDIGLLLDHFLRVLAQRFNKKLSGFSRPARDLLMSYAYPGNVRELKNIVEYAANICQGEVLDVEHVPAYLLEAPASAVLAGESEGWERALKDDGVHEPGAGVKWPEVERRIILDALVRSRGRRRRAAEILGWGRSTLWRKMRQYGIEG